MLTSAVQRSDSVNTYTVFIMFFSIMVYLRVLSVAPPVLCSSALLYTFLLFISHSIYGNLPKQPECTKTGSEVRVRGGHWSVVLDRSLHRWSGTGAGQCIKKVIVKNLGK